jgi:choline dehydrogenase-like flavoprotein
MPAVISGNTNAPSLMIGERAADFIAADASVGSAARAAPSI